MDIFKNSNFDFLRWRWHAIALSTLVIAAGLFTIATKGIPRGVEFSGGTIVIMEFEQQPQLQEIRTALNRAFGGQSVVVNDYGEPGRHQVMVRVPQTGEEQGTQLSAAAQTVEKAVVDANIGKVTVVGTEIVGPSVGRDLTTKGTSAMILSLGGILLYIAFRYQFSFAVGAVVATVHDLLVTLAFLAFFQYDITLNIIAAILTVAGYSSNDTIVIFDRVRENLRSMRRDSLSHVINVSVNQTLGRTILTAGTTFLATLALYLFGGEVLRGIAFTMIVGVITGTYSTVFIAAAIVTLWHRKGAPRAMASAPQPPANPAGGSAPASHRPDVRGAQQPVRKAKPQRKARAS
jgi:preprotein translocase subunit SecF